jgi:cysteine synthase
MLEATVSTSTPARPSAIRFSSITGVGEVLRVVYPRVRIVGVEPTGSPILSGGKPGGHKIQGSGAGFVPQVLNTALLDEVVTVTDEETFDMARRLAREEG